MGASTRYPGLKAAWIGLSLAAFAAAQIPDAPPRPTCTALAGPGSCDWKPTNGVGPGVTVVLSDRTGGHQKSKLYLFNALTRLSQTYGFTLVRITELNDITDAYLQNAKVIIFSSGDGTVGGSIPNLEVRTRVENFVKQSGWGMIMIHAACAFISTWPFHEQACVQQYNHQNGPGTRATIYAENRTSDGVGHGRANPYTSFLLDGLSDSVSMTDEIYTWKSAPIATNMVDTVPIVNKIMLLAANEGSYNSASPRYAADHNLAWTHTQGKGITVFNSMGHDDVYVQDGTRRAYGDSLLWREIRYAAKDWGPVPVVSLVASRIRPRFSLSGSSGSLSFSFSGSAPVSLSAMDVAGRQVYARTFSGERSAEIRNLKRGVYFVNIGSGREVETRKVTLY